MAEGFKRFDGVAPLEEPGEPVGFNLGDEAFVCIHAVPAIALRVKGGVLGTSEMIDFLESVLVDKDDPQDDTPTQIERFREVLGSKDKVFTGQQISDIVAYVAGELSKPKRPTRRPGGSRAGRRSTGPTSAASSPPQDKTSTG